MVQLKGHTTDGVMNSNSACHHWIVVHAYSEMRFVLEVYMICNQKQWVLITMVKWTSNFFSKYVQ
jgi:hypothetical protein